jgi:polyketide cyclase/dehydrase/lipid transport protein
MAKAYYSAVIPSLASAVWNAARDFGDYRLFNAGKGNAFVEDGRGGDCVGAVHNATIDGRTIRQRLLSHSDCEMRYQYEFCDHAPFPVENYVATLQFKPIVDIRRVERDLRLRTEKSRRDQREFRTDVCDLDCIAAPRGDFARRRRLTDLPRRRGNKKGGRSAALLNFG